ncbi:hypothetical protein HT574_15580 [Parageobacillus sp. VR-IP]|jgi:hypothetical protein|uniref:YneQ n=2 Tax=Saccharococcus caldoxylosilyticus TaxID=81408 RepID=A0A023DFI7_9BACL|nr:MULTISPECIES: hypothetical protein [Parageobacillus]OQP01267.1 hypothetical protein BSK33_12480 [Geobacillus sp. 44B]KYD15811.1 hypothetical protein B4119_2239 [Parageobacillus caldoxylosilyticus]MBB3851551.1 hypothetical protein [Parageobacillus caldoxylosilyticus]NUK31457.1 hypothetical protein [Parageobacillus sp. VR-IP]QNU37382.1 hypothetical protein IC801_16790 [Geobacillus sp. 44B]
MAFGIRRWELMEWKEKVKRGEIAFLTHYWYDERFPEYTSVTKVGCSDIEKLAAWGKQYGLRKEWIHRRGEFSHFDLLGETQKEILQQEGLTEHLLRFHL